MMMIMSNGPKNSIQKDFVSGEVFDYLVAHGRMKEKEARAKFRQVTNHISRDYITRNCCV
jgi:hypothetical protein